jgi:TRAP-type C4-dicarboxylate transport system permease small subunit
MRTNFFDKSLSVLNRVGRLDVVVSTISMFAIVCISIYGVVTRYFVGRPSGWVEELSLALFVWLTFFGVSILARRGEIVNIEFLLQFFPDRLSFFVKKILTAVLLAGCLVVIIYLGFKLALFSHDRYTSLLRIPFSYIYLGIPLGSLFTLYHVLHYAFAGPQHLEDIEAMS